MHADTLVKTIDKKETRTDKKCVKKRVSILHKKSIVLRIQNQQTDRQTDRDMYYSIGNL